jgi:hypothetical protein
MASRAETGTGDRPAALPLPRRRQAETRTLLLVSGMLLVDSTAERDDASVLTDWLAHVRFDDVLEVARKLQVFATDDPPPSVTDADSLASWAEHRRRDILSTDASDYRPISKPTAYTVFDNELDYRQHLAHELLGRGRASDPDGMREVLDGLVAEHGIPVPLEHVVDRLTDHEFRRVRHLAAATAEFGAAPYARHPAIRDALRSTYEANTDPEQPRSLAALWRHLLPLIGRRLRDGVTERHLGTCFKAVIDGFLHLERTWPEGVDAPVPSGAGSRTLLAESIEGVLRQLTLEL